MSNTIGWGKGASNNSIGWGNVGTNGFGSIYSRSNSGETDLADEANVFEDAAVAYSLRDLGLGVTSNVIRVRRSSDNLEQNFTATQITDGTLTTFCGAGEGFVSIWYDQKGVNNAIQSTANRQSKIVSLGSLVLQNSKPAVDVSIENRYFISNLILENNASIILVTQNSTQTIDGSIHRPIFCSQQDAYIFNSEGYGLGLSRDSSDGVRFVAPKLDSKIEITLNKPTDNNLALITAYERDGIASLFYNSSEEVTMTYTKRISNFNIGYQLFGMPISGRDYQGKCSEIIVYNTNKYQERTQIETNINNHYAIY